MLACSFQRLTPSWLAADPRASQLYTAFSPGIAAPGWFWSRSGGVTGDGTALSTLVVTAADAVACAT